MRRWGKNGDTTFISQIGISSSEGSGVCEWSAIYLALPGPRQALQQQQHHAYTTRPPSIS